MFQKSWGQSDVGITAVLHPLAILCTGDSVKVKIKNYGATAVSNIPVEVKIIGASNTTLNNIFISSIAAGIEDSFNVGVVITGSSGFISITAYTKLAGDANINNDTLVAFRNIAPSPSVSISAVDSTCYNVGFALTANGASTYIWSGGSIPTPSNVNPYVHAPSSVGTYTYQVVGTNTSGCKDTKFKTVKIQALPTIVTVADTTCPGDIATISASGGVGYNWGIFGNTASINVSPQTTKNYTVTVTSSVNCTASATTFVMVRQKPLISVQHDSICINEIANLKAYGGVSYNWGAFGATDTINVSPSITSYYSVTVTDAYNCTNSNTATAFVRANPTIICLVDSLCSGQIARIDAKGAFSYNWGALGTNAYAFVSPSINTNYSVTGTDIYGCTGVGTASVIMKPGITVKAIGDTACKGDDITISVINPSSANFYSWGTLGDGPELTFKSTVTNSYRVLATAPNGCTAEAVAFVLVENKPSLNISISKNVLCLGESALLLAGIPSGGIMTGKGVFNSQMFPDSAGIGTHTIKYVYSTTNAGCTDSFSRTIKVAKCTNDIANVTGIQKVITFPNPFDNLLQVNIKGVKEGKTIVTLLDLSGRIIEKKEIMLNPTSDNNVLFETAHLNAGLYQIRIIKNDEAFVLSVMKY